MADGEQWYHLKLQELIDFLEKQLLNAELSPHERRAWRNEMNVLIGMLSYDQIPDWVSELGDGAMRDAQLVGRFGETVQSGHRLECGQCVQRRQAAKSGTLHEKDSNTR